MKKIICLLMALIAAAALTGCGDNSTDAKPVGNTGSNVQSVLDQQMKQAADVQTQSLPPVVPAPADNQDTDGGKPERAAEKSTYDVDLTTLSSTMVYSEVYDMMTAPDSYIGKTVRMSGQFDVFQVKDQWGEPVPWQTYFSCVIADATACCAQGLEFVLAGEYAYPEDYPELGADITVSGTFETYYEGSQRYCHLVDAVFE